MTQSALALLMMTATRPGELRGARWDEFNERAATWRIPASRMKMKTEHTVPLSKQALTLLAQMRQLSGDGSLVFPSPFYPGKPLSDGTLNSALARLGYKGMVTGSVAIRTRGSAKPPSGSRIKQPANRTGLRRTWLPFGAVQLPLADHVHGLDARNEFASATDVLEPQHWPHDSLDGPVILLDEVVGVPLISVQ